MGSPEAENLCGKEGFGNYGAVSEAQNSMNNVSANNISEPDDGETMVLLDGKNGNTNPYIERKTSGEKLDARSYISKVCMGGDYESNVPGDVSKKKVKIKDEVDYDTPGSYEITYSAKSGKSRTGTVRLIVIVTE